MNYSGFSCKVTKIVITYDLSNNNISAQEIADASNGIFKTCIAIQDSGRLQLPDTTLVSSKNIGVQEAVDKFKQAFDLAKGKKHSTCTISCLFCCGVEGKDGYIENN